jgi:hypothetical protein
MSEAGTVEWCFETGGAVKSSPTVVDGTVYFGSIDTHLYAVDAESGCELWRFETGGAVESSPIVVDGTVYVGSDDGNLYGISAGVEGSSEDSRVRQGVLNHHHDWEERSQDTVIEIKSKEQGNQKGIDSEYSSILDTISDEFDGLGN